MLSLFLAASFSVGYACIPTLSPDDRPDIPGVFTTKTLPAGVTTTININPTSTTTATTTPTTTTTSATTTTTSTTTTSTTTTTSYICPPDYTLWMDPMTSTSACYYVSPFAGPDFPTWADARAICMAAGGDLVTIKSTVKNNFITSLAEVGVSVPPYPSVLSRMVWIGGTCTLGPGVFCSRALGGIPNWMYLDGTYVDPAWAPFCSICSYQQPDGDGFCLSLLSNNDLFMEPSIGFWHDLPCGNTGRYACEAPATMSG